MSSRMFQELKETSRDLQTLTSLNLKEIFSYNQLKDIYMWNIKVGAFMYFNALIFKT